MIRLSVNLNKVALLRNSRTTGVPSVLQFARLAVDAGAQGVTVHPRPDERHIRKSDVRELGIHLRDVRPRFELNVEGRPSDDFLALVEEVRPEQCTLVPDGPSVLTSDTGWSWEEFDFLQASVRRAKAAGARTCIFVDPTPESPLLARDVEADGMEIYTGGYASAILAGPAESLLEGMYECARKAAEMGLIVNAGHDLNTTNLLLLRDLPALREVSIGHELTSDSLIVGMRQAVLNYRLALGQQL